ncbi:MAG: YceI family protein [Bacteroidetes bacterium]|nr:YceI family protein [Bacteroidota bacterium]
MKFLLTIALAFLLSATAFANGNDHHGTPAAAEWTIDAAHSSVKFNIRHFFTPVPGTFERWSGAIHFDPENLAGSKIDVTIDVSSVNTQNTRRDEHLRDPDFFEVTTWPEMTFRSTDIRAAGDNEFIATGELTIRDVSKTIELPFRLLGVMDHPMRENTLVAGFEANTSLSRLEYGVGSGSFVQTAVVGEDVNIDIFLEVTRTK